MTTRSFLTLLTLALSLVFAHAQPVRPTPLTTNTASSANTRWLSITPGTTVNAWELRDTNNNVVALMTSNGIFGAIGVVGSTNPSFRVQWTNGATFFETDSNGTVLVRGITGATTDFMQWLTTNGARVGFYRSNHTFGASNLVQFPQAMPTGGGGDEQGVAWPLFTLTNAVTVTNTTSATSLITNGGKGSQTIAGNVLRPGSHLRIRAFGIMTSSSANVCTFGLRFGNGLNVATNILALPTTLVSDFWRMEVIVRVGATGASGNAIGWGNIAYPTSSGGANGLLDKRLQAGPVATSVTIDTTASLVVDLFTIPGATTHGLTILECLIEVVP